MACTRFFTTDAIYDVLKTINSIDDMMYDYLEKHRTNIQNDDFTSMVIGYDKRIKASAANKYTPANVKVLMPMQRILPRGFQTGSADEISGTIKEIDEILKSVPGFKIANDIDNKADPFFLIDYDTAVKIIHLISSTYRYGEEYNNVKYEWDDNEMVTALDHCVFNTDGKIYCQVYTNREMGRLRQDPNDKRGPFIDSPEGGETVTRARNKAIDRPVLTLLRQKGSSIQGWRDTPFWWPALMLNKDMAAGMFTINAKKDFGASRVQLRMDALKNYPKEEVLKLTIMTDPFFAILSDEKKFEMREIKSTTASMYLERDEKGNFIKVPGLDPNKYYGLNTYNDGVFPFKVRDYKYIHLRLSQDLSGSQAIIELDDKEPYSFDCEQKDIKDMVYSKDNIAHEAVDTDYCTWAIIYNIKKVREVMLTAQDKEAFEEYKKSLETEE